MCKSDVSEFASANGITMIEGKDIITEWESFLEKTGLEL